MSAWVDRIADLLVSNRNLLLAIGSALAIAAAVATGQLAFDQSVESMFTADDPVLVSYQKLKRTFGGNKIVLAVYEDPALLSPDASGIRRLESITTQLESVAGVDAAFGLHDPLGEMIVHPNNTVAAKARQLFEGTTHSADGTMAAIACMLDPACEPDDELRAIEGLRTIMQSPPAPLQPGFITGEPVIVADGFRLISRDGRQLTIASALLLTVTIGVFFRRLRWLLAPIVVVQVVLLFTRSLIAMAGIQMTMISSVLNSVAMVITVATLVHFIVRFEALRKRGMDAVPALRETLRQLTAPVFWALMTDAAGFAALMTAKVGPIHDYGLIMTMATMMVLVTFAVILPGLATIGANSRDSLAPGESPENGKALHSNGAGDEISTIDRLTLWALDRRRWVLLAVAMIAVMSIWGLRFLEVETDFTKNFREGSDIVRGYELVETRMGGAGVCEVILPAPKNLTWEYLQRVEAMQNELRSELGSGAGLTKVMSMLDGLAMARMPAMDSLPKVLQDAALRTAIVFVKTKMPNFFGSMVGTDPDSGEQYYRVIMRALERQPAEKKRALIQRIDSICTSHFPKAEVTGFYVLLSNLIGSVLRDQRLSFAAAILGIVGVMAIAFRSLKIAAIAVIPNLLPILVVTGTMGWLSAAGWEIKTNLGVALIAAVSLGLSVDCTIHYVIAMQRAMRDGMTFRQAVSVVNQTVARALVVSTLALIIGFAVLCRSEFVPTVYFGAMVSLAMLGGLIGNLLVLPVIWQTTQSTP